MGRKGSPRTKKARKEEAAKSSQLFPSLLCKGAKRAEHAFGFSSQGCLVGGP
jgi:hypothetical protein